MRLFLLAACALLLHADSNYTVVPGAGGMVKGCLFFTNGRPAVGVEVTFYTAPPGLKSGSHYHDTGSGRPNLVLDRSYAYTGPDGCASVDIIVPMFAGSYSIYVTGDGLSTHINFTASVAGMTQLYVVTGMAPLSTFYDAGHGNEWMGKSPTVLWIEGIAGSWHRSNYDALYGGMTLTRFALTNWPTSAGRRT
jgi:hypothetical protein